MAVIVLRSDEVLMVRQYRLLIDRPSWEIPGGSVDDGESPLKAAQRECREETGVECFNLEQLIHFHPGLDTVYNPTYIYVTREYQETSSASHCLKEVQDWAWIPLSGCLEMLSKSEILDSLTVIGLLACYRQLTEVRFA